MKKINWLLLLGVITFASLTTIPCLAQSSPNTPKKAQSSSSDDDTVDLKKLTCRELLKAEGEERTNLLIYMHGFMNGKKGEMIINPPVLTNVTDKVMDACIATPDQKLLGVFEKNR